MHPAHPENIDGTNLQEDPGRVEISKRKAVALELAMAKAGNFYGDRQGMKLWKEIVSNFRALPDRALLPPKSPRSRESPVCLILGKLLHTVMSATKFLHRLVSRLMSYRTLYG